MALRNRALESVLQEEGRLTPSSEFREQANLSDDEIYERALADPEGFWADRARELDWIEPWHTTLEWAPPHARWFVGGKLNASYNCLDRHLDGARRNKAALVWEGEPGDRRVRTYWDLHREVCKFSNVLRDLGVRKGDRVAIYLPMIPEVAVAMLACARIGAPHTVVFGGFSAESLSDRINDTGARVLVTADHGWRRGRIVPLKDNADQALESAPSIERVVVVRRRAGDDAPVSMRRGRDLWYHELMRDAAGVAAVEPMDAEDPLYILYTSGTTGKPKGAVHTTGGYLTQVHATTSWVFDLKEDDCFWCTADVGWVTGHSYVVYGPLAVGATVVMYEGAPDWPDRDRIWRMIEDYGVTIFYTAPTAIRAFMRWGAEWPGRHDLSTLRLLGTVGEPINPAAWVWYHEVIGAGRCPVVDTWWQTETGAIMISPLPGLTVTKPGSATRALPGITAEILNDAGDPASEGYLAITKPWPAMMRTIYGDDERYLETYWSKWPGLYFAGDGAKIDDDGYFWISGRIDDVLNVAGHRIGTMELESALVSHEAVAEAAVVGKEHELKGQAIAAFVTLREGKRPSLELREELVERVVEKIGAIARPDDILFTADLPKTRSGKIMRRLLRDIADGRALGDTTTLADPAVVAALKEQYEEQEA
jgi:acetyl-CoA synthetase